MRAAAETYDMLRNALGGRPARPNEERGKEKRGRRQSGKREAGRSRPAAPVRPEPADPGCVPRFRPTDRRAGSRDRQGAEEEIEKGNPRVCGACYERLRTDAVTKQ